MQGVTEYSVIKPYSSH